MDTMLNEEDGQNEPNFEEQDFEGQVKTTTPSMEIPRLKKDEGASTSFDSNLEYQSTFSEVEFDDNLNSTSTLMSLDLEVPSSYKVETVDFPSSPAELKRRKGLNLTYEAEDMPSDDEDRSIYEAHLMSNGQDVRLSKDQKLAEKKKSRRKVIPVAVESLLHAADSSVTDDSFTECPTDEDSATECPLDGLDSPDELNDEELLSRLSDVELIPELTAEEEAQESRSWRLFSLAGVDRHIDLRVLEPYKRVISHGGYLSQGSKNAIIVFSACYLPDRSRIDYDYVMNHLFMYVISTLDQLVTDDYVIVYLHGATTSSVMPKFSWLKQCYQMIHRKLRKNLKGLYLVHPTFWLKTLVIMTRPFISSKFSKKLFFISSLKELLRKIPLEHASIPDQVVKYDNLKEAIKNGY